MSILTIPLPIIVHCILNIISIIHLHKNVGQKHCWTLQYTTNMYIKLLMRKKYLQGIIIFDTYINLHVYHF